MIEQAEALVGRLGSLNGAMVQRGARSRATWRLRPSGRQTVGLCGRHTGGAVRGWA